MVVKNDKNAGGVNVTLSFWCSPQGILQIFRDNFKSFRTEQKLLFFRYHSSILHELINYVSIQYGLISIKKYVSIRKNNHHNVFGRIQRAGVQAILFKHKNRFDST